MPLVFNKMGHFFVKINVRFFVKIFCISTFSIFPHKEVHNTVKPRNSQLQNCEKTRINGQSSNDRIFIFDNL